MVDFNRERCQSVRRPPRASQVGTRDVFQQTVERHLDVARDELRELDRLRTWSGLKDDDAIRVDRIECESGMITSKLPRYENGLTRTISLGSKFYSPFWYSFCLLPYESVEE